MLDAQRSDVRTLTRKAGVNPTVTRADQRHPVLQEIAPGERSFPGGMMKPEVPQQQSPRRRGGDAPRPRNGSGRPRRPAAAATASTGGAARFSAESGRRRGR